MSTFQTACGGFVFTTPAVDAHLEAHNDVLQLLPEAIGKITLPADGELNEEVDLGRIVGRSGRASLDLRKELNEPILFAIRQGRSDPSPIVAGDGDEVSTVVLIANRSNDCRRFFLRTAWIGRKARPFPWDRRIKTHEAFLDSLNFWTSNALVFEQTLMCEPYTSTWRNVLKDLGCRFAY